MLIHNYEVHLTNRQFQNLNLFFRVVCTFVVWLAYVGGSEGTCSYGVFSYGMISSSEQLTIFFLAFLNVLLLFPYSKNFLHM